jgi:hypothetical protein
MANTQLAIRLMMEPQRSVAAGDFTTGYIGIGTAFDHPLRMIFIQNLTDVTLQFSLDGVNPHFPLPSEGFLLMDITSNKSIGEGFYIAQGSRIYVEEITDFPSTGAVYVSVMYAAD